MLLKRLLKIKRENFLITFLNGQFLFDQIPIVINIFLNTIHKPKYDFWVN